MILAWVLSLVLIGSSLILNLERMTALMTTEAKTMGTAHQQFIAAEKTVLDCEKNINNLNSSTSIESDLCLIESIKKHTWRISSKAKPGIEIHVYWDEKRNQVQRLNWRQVFE